MLPYYYTIVFLKIIFLFKKNMCYLIIADIEQICIFSIIWIESDQNDLFIYNLINSFYLTLQGISIFFQKFYMMEF